MSYIDHLKHERNQSFFWIDHIVKEDNIIDLGLAHGLLLAVGEACHALARHERLAVGRLGQHPNVYYAQGYSGHGLNVTHWTAKLLAESIALGHSHGLDVFSAVPHLTFPGGRALRTPLLALGMTAPITVRWWWIAI